MGGKFSSDEGFLIIVEVILLELEVEMLALILVILSTK